MTRGLIRLMAASMLLGAAAIPACAQPSRIGNVYDGTAHEPDPLATGAQEKAAGVALPPRQQQQQNGEVEQLDKQILGNARKPSAAISPACKLNPGRC